MEQLVDRLRNDVPGVDIVLIGTYNSGIPQTADLVNGMADAAVSRNVGFMNIYEAGGPRLFYVDNNYLDDDVHFNHRGGRYLGRLLFDAFETDGASLALPPTPSCEGDFNLDKATDTADLSLFLGTFGTFVQTPYTNGDMNGDQIINGADLSVLLADFGCTRP
jgi:hypothetical protein